MAWPDQRAGRTGSQAGTQAVVVVVVVGPVPVAVGGPTVVGVVDPRSTPHHPMLMPSPTQANCNGISPEILKTEVAAR
jgi:hypothetical protein